MGVEVTIFDPSGGGALARAFDRSPIRVGRDPSCDLHLPFPFVSVQHALIHFDGERLDYVDVGSRNGTLRGGRPLPPHQPVAVGERLVVTIGRIELTIRRGGAPRPSAAGEVTHDLAQVHELLAALRPLHDQATRALDALATATRAGLGELPPRARALAEAMIERELPALRHRGASS